MRMPAARDRLHVDLQGLAGLLGELFAILLIWHDLDLRVGQALAVLRDENRRLAAMNDERRANTAPHRAGELHRPLRIVDVQEGVGNLAILLMIDAARRRDAQRELAADGQKQRGHRIEKVGGNPA